jgi:response regulator RpfG family c-di-GMP phosphodiesterase
MTLLATAGSQTQDAVRVLSAVADTFSGRGIGFGMRVANVASRFAVYRELDPEAVAATFYAGALHGIGAIRVVVPRDASPRAVEIFGWDDPPAGASIVAAAHAFPAATADAIRWHREAFDGTGFPDQLRWNSIPETAMAINIARAFVAALDAHGQLGSTRDALFELGAETGCVYALTAMREFRAFLEAEAEACVTPFEPRRRLADIDARALVARICTEIDARQTRTAGRGDRLAGIVRTILARLDEPQLDPEEVAFAGRLTALARTGNDGSADDVFTLTRLGLESRAARASAAARIVSTGPTFAAFAPAVGAIEEWYDGSGLPDHRAGAAIELTARVLAVAIAAEALTAGELTAADAGRRIAAAAGSRLDPAVVRAYLAADVRP